MSSCARRRARPLLKLAGCRRAIVLTGGVDGLALVDRGRLHRSRHGASDDSDAGGARGPARDRRARRRSTRSHGCRSRTSISSRAPSSRSRRRAASRILPADGDEHTGGAPTGHPWRSCRRCFANRRSGASWRRWCCIASATRDRVALIDPPFAACDRDRLGVAAVRACAGYSIRPIAALYFPWLEVVDPATARRAQPTWRYRRAATWPGRSRRPTARRSPQGARQRAACNGGARHLRRSMKRPTACSTAKAST